MKYRVFFAGIFCIFTSYRPVSLIYAFNSVTFFAICFGAIIGTLLIAMFSKVFLIFAKINAVLAISLVVIAAIMIIVFYLYKRYKKKKTV